MTACIVGWGHTPFGKHDAETVESLITRVAREALEHAGVTAREIDQIYLGHFNAGFSPQDFTAALVLQADENFRFKPATRVENACATGSAAVHQALNAIEAKAARLVLVVGVEQMTRTPPAQIGENLLRASYLPEDGQRPLASPASSARSPAVIFSAMATNPTRSPSSRRRITRTASTILSRRCARIWVTSSVARRAKRTPSLPAP